MSTPTHLDPDTTTRSLGHSGLSTPFPIVLGSNVFGWNLDEATSFKLLDAAFAAGVRAIDTADIYSAWAEGNSGGESETIIGNWMAARGNRDQILLITKVGAELAEGKHDLSRASILRRAKASLERLKTDRIDLLFSHFDDGKTAPEESLGAYQELIEAGQVRAIGASNFDRTRLQASLDAASRENLPAYTVFQPGYSLVNREGFEQGVGPLCREAGLGVITYFPLASGFLTGKYRSEDDLGKSIRGGGVKKYLNPEGLAVLEVLDQIAEYHKASPAGIALAWQLTRPGISAPIASITKEAHLDAFHEAARVRLSEEDLERLEAVSRPF